VARQQLNPWNDMSDEADRIRRQMQNVRQDVGDNVKDIVHGARQLSDWRYYVRRHPWACIGSAFAVGFLAMPGRRKSLPADLQKVVEQLRASGLGVTAAQATSGSSLAGRLVAMAAPILVRQVLPLVAQYMASAKGEPSPSRTGVGGP
jgi:hypothetical protein